jgi:hypothetical protein
VPNCNILLFSSLKVNEKLLLLLLGTLLPNQAQVPWYP